MLTSMVLFLEVLFPLETLPSVIPKTSSAASQNTAVSPPKVRVYLEGTQIYEGREITLDVEVSWPVEAADYAVRPPEFDLPKGLEQISAASSSDSEKQGLLTYRFGIMVQKAGAYKISPVKVSYLTAGAKKEDFLEVEGISFEAVTYTWLGLRPKYWWLIGGSTSAILVLSGWLLVMRKRRQERIQADPANQQKVQVLQLLSLCQSHKTDGRYDKFFEAAEAAYKTMGVEDISGNIGPVIDKIRFGGYNPTPEEADRAYCELENKLKEIFPDN